MDTYDAMNKVQRIRTEVAKRNFAAEHALDVDFETARALHRVVRAMHDGECPNCHAIYPSQQIKSWTRTTDGKPPNGLGTQFLMDYLCPTCGFAITYEEATAAINAFAPVMDKCLEVFEQWRAQRNATTASQPNLS